MDIKCLTSICVFTPLLTSIISGFFRKSLGKVGAHSLTILGLLLSFLAAIMIAGSVLDGSGQSLEYHVYTVASGSTWFPYTLDIGFLIDPLTVVMMLIVTFVSFLVHIYSVGYMHDDSGYQRFFSYISLFTFMMLMLVTANNFLQLFFGWEGVGLVSYLLIGFWYDRQSALEGSLKAFLVNRVGDFGFILGIALILKCTGSLDYTQVFAARGGLLSETAWLGFGHSLPMIGIICTLLFIGAMGKSAQIPLHVWLPESMEGPTPISALIHAATMVTAGIFMIARLSPLYALSPFAQSLVLIIGASGALLMGLIGVVMCDIKRVIAYSTLSQLGYMMVALGSSAYSIGIFHLLTHACFKALLFLAAGSVIIGMHHEQDMRQMGGLRRKMPVTFVCYWVGCLALCAYPPFSGFFSKDSIIAAAYHSHIFGHCYAYVCVLLGAMVTAFYTFRSLFLTFYGEFRGKASVWEHCHESPMVVCLPLILLSIPSILLGGMLYRSMVLQNPGLLGSSVVGFSLYPQVSGIVESMVDGLKEWPFYLTIFGSIAAWLCYIRYPKLPVYFSQKFALLYRILLQKFGFDRFNDWVWVRGTKSLGKTFFVTVDQGVIDGWVVNGTVGLTGRVASVVRHLQSGYLFHYLTLMVLGLMFIIFWFLVI